jgi:hypothetical protein
LNHTPNSGKEGDRIPDKEVGRERRNEPFNQGLRDPRHGPREGTGRVEKAQHQDDDLLADPLSGAMFGYGRRRMRP